VEEVETLDRVLAGADVAEAPVPDDAVAVDDDLQRLNAAVGGCVVEESLNPLLLRVSRETVAGEGLTLQRQDGIRRLGEVVGQQRVRRLLGTSVRRILLGQDGDELLDEVLGLLARNARAAAVAALAWNGAGDTATVAAEWAATRTGTTDRAVITATDTTTLSWDRTGNAVAIVLAWNATGASSWLLWAVATLAWNRTGNAVTAAVLTR